MIRAHVFGVHGVCGIIGYPDWRFCRQFAAGRWLCRRRYDGDCGDGTAGKYAGGRSSGVVAFAGYKLADIILLDCVPKSRSARGWMRTVTANAYNA